MRYDLRQLLGIAQQLEPYIRSMSGVTDESSQAPGPTPVVPPSSATGSGGGGGGGGSGNTVSFEMTNESGGQQQKATRSSKHHQRPVSSRSAAYINQVSAVAAQSLQTSSSSGQPMVQGMELSEEYKRRYVCLCFSRLYSNENMTSFMNTSYFVCL